ncbi:MAG: DUF1254 domain-containing protein [Candidatus Competibacteraceae bacterium]|nr:DUF1254 domain-containing protein [Candidatus Competibacteraceae bacterium]MCB1808142.1 DUF1254 domain-containing protein [Candidatus Competibacteraceae bacterium]MCB1811485.1 DUF1254 domain-containing protein [Candidatus Competibacteraceae bacterium]
MRVNIVSTGVLASLLIVGVTGLASAQAPEMKMTTDIPPGIATPNKLETRIGTLHLIDGVPDKETAQKVYDNLDFQRGVHAYLNSIHIASMYGMRKGILEFGPANTTALLFETLMDSKALWLTPNTTNIYMTTWLELKDEPMVIETPPNVLGIIDDHWFHYVADFGNAGPDKGKGGRFLILPPGYKGEVPEGYHVARTKTYGNWVIWRGFQVDGDPAPAVETTKKFFRIYPLSEKDNPPKMNFVNVSGKFNNTIHRTDYGIYAEINEVVQAEPADSMDPETLGLLASIGIKKGQPFEPDARMQKILTEAAAVGAATVRTLTARPRDDKFYFYSGESAWSTPFPGGSYQFLDAGARVLDARSYFHFYATGITPAMTMKMEGKGSQYAVAYVDGNDLALDGGKLYKVHLPPNVPAKDFWSFTLYDNQTRAMLQTDQQFPGIDNNQAGLQQNSDGSYDIYFGPQAPAGQEGNWLQTIPGKGWNMIFRLYGPLKPWFDKTWRPGDPELVN